jgi:hypothetical protein
MGDKISTLLKEAAFNAELKRRLFLEGFTLAIPEPDLGDDLWILNPGTENTEPSGSTTRQVVNGPELWRCQIKSALPSAKEGDDHKYMINFTESHQSRSQQLFYYLIGLYDSAINEFHIACLPSKFFKGLNDKKRIRYNKEGRPMLDFFLSTTADYPKFTLRLNPTVRYAREGRANVEEFFIPKGRTLREAFQCCHSWDGPVQLLPPKPRKRSRNR